VLRHALRARFLLLSRMGGWFRVRRRSVARAGLCGGGGLVAEGAEGPEPVNTREEIERALDLGADGVMTDDVVLLRDVLAERGQWHPRVPA